MDTKSDISVGAIAETKAMDTKPDIIKGTMRGTSPEDVEIARMYNLDIISAERGDRPPPTVEQEHKGRNQKKTQSPQEDNRAFLKTIRGYVDEYAEQYRKSTGVGKPGVFGGNRKKSKKTRKYNSKKQNKTKNKKQAIKQKRKSSKKANIKTRMNKRKTNKSK